jgi:uncharacterized C2H2 Zn-finger protein
MADRTCPSCNKIFKYPSVLKKHLEIALHCIKTTNEINEFMSLIQISKSNTNYSNKCNHCNKLFTRKYNYNRHINNCGVIHIPKQSSKQTNINLHQPQLINNINNTINNTTTTNNINNTINNNNVIINIQHIYPFGFEKLPNISKEEMKKLLLSGDKGVIDIIKLVYEQDENKNFYKINMKNNNISYLNDKYKLDICQENEMKATLYKNCISLPNDMLVICKDILTTDEILFINSNNKSITENIKKEIYDNGLKNIINNQLIYNGKNTKININKYINILNNNPIAKQNAFNNLDNVLAISQNTKTEFIPKLSLSQINEVLGNPCSSPELTNSVTHHDFCMKKFEDTKYKKYWDKRKKDEKKLIMTLSNKKIGDIIDLENRLNNIEQKLNTMEYKHKDITFNSDLINVDIASEYTKTNRNNVSLEI